MATKRHSSASEHNSLTIDVDLVVQNEIDNTKDFQQMQNVENMATSSSVFMKDIWSLVIVLASFFSCFIVGITYISFSVFYMYFVEHFDSDKAASGWIGSLYLATGNILGIIFSVFIKFYGCRLVAVVGGLTWFFGFAVSAIAPNISFLYFSYGLIAGMGFNMVTLSSFVVVQQYFEKHRAFAAGMAATGISVGTLSGGPIIVYLIVVFGWRGAMLILSGIAANCAVLGCLYRPVRKSEKSSLHKNLSAASKKAENEDAAGKENSGLCGVLGQLLKDMTNFTLFRNLAFSLCCFGSFFMNIGLVIFYQHTPSRAVSLGMDKVRAAMLPAAIGITTVAGRIIGSIVGNMNCTNRTLQYGVCLTLGGILLIVNTITMTFEAIALVGSAIGFLGGCALTVQTTVLSDLVGVENIARAQAFVLVATGLGALIAVPLAGFIYDKTLNYSIPFYTGGSVQMLGGTLIILAAVLRKLQYKDSR